MLADVHDKPQEYLVLWFNRRVTPLRFDLLRKIVRGRPGTVSNVVVFNVLVFNGTTPLETLETLSIQYCGVGARRPCILLDYLIKLSLRTIVGSHALHPSPGHPPETPALRLKVMMNASSDDPHFCLLSPVETATLFLVVSFDALQSLFL